MKSRTIAGLVFAGLYLGFIFLPMLPDRLILFPSTQAIDAGGATRRTVAMGRAEIEIWTATSRAARVRGNPEFYVLRFYGNADRPELWVASEAEVWAGRAVEVWGVNYPGYGGSTGPARLAKLGPAALAAFDALRVEAGDRPIIVHGASLGTTTALYVAAHRSIDGLILHNPPTIRQMILGQFGWWNLWLVAGPWALRIPNALESVANAKASKGRAIFLLAENDEVVAPKFQALVVNAYAGETRVVPLRGAGHNSPLSEAAQMEIDRGIDWLLAGPRGTAGN